MTIIMARVPAIKPIDCNTFFKPLASDYARQTSPYDLSHHCTYHDQLKGWRVETAGQYGEKRH